MRLPLSIISLFVGASVPALAVSLSGKVIDQSGAGKSGVTVSFQGAKATTGTDGTWALSGNNTGISSRLSGSRQITTGGHLLVDEGHLRVSLSGYDLMGRPRAGSAVAAVPTGTTSGISARASTAGVDTILYSWNGKTFLRDTASVSRSGIVGIFDTTVNDSIIYGWLTDTRDNQVYRTVMIGSQMWMAMNLNYKRGTDSDSGWCPNATPRATAGPIDSCTKYGRLYTWAEMMDTSSIFNGKLLGAALPHQGICPSGWHTPSDTEWQILEMAVGMSASEAHSSPNMQFNGIRGATEGVGRKLKSASSWVDSDNGTDSLGFRVLPAGYYYGSYPLSLSGVAYFWTSSEVADEFVTDGSDEAWFRRFDYFISTGVYRSPGIENYDGDWGKGIGLSVRCIKN